MQLVLVPHRRRAALEIAHVRAFVGDDERALELPGVPGVDAEIGGQFHRTADAFGDIGERPVTEDRRVERREEVVGVWHDGAEVLPHESGMLLHRLGERTEDDPQLRQLRAERRRDRDAVEHGVDRDAGEQLLFLERNPELLEGGADFRIDLVEAVERRPLLGRRVIDNVLVLDRRVAHVLPRRLGHGEPGAVRLQAPLEQPRRLAFLLGNQPDDLLVETFWDGLGFDIGDEAELVFPVSEFLDRAGRCGHCWSSPASPSGLAR